MPPDPELILGLWVAAIGAFVWRWLPMLVSACGGIIYRNGGSEDPSAIEPDGSDPAYARLFADLTARGYEPIGPGFMRLTFYLRFWVIQTKVRAFRSRSAGRFAFMNEWPTLPGWHQVFLASCGKQQELVLTVGGLTRGTLVEDDYSARELPTDDLDQLERRHDHTMKVLIDDGWKPDPDLSLVTLLLATERHSRTNTIDPTVGIARKEVALVTVPHVIVTATLAWWFGLDTMIAPVACLALTMLYTMNVRAKEKNAARALRERAAAEHDAGW